MSFRTAAMVARILPRRNRMNRMNRTVARIASTCPPYTRRYHAASSIPSRSSRNKNNRQSRATSRFLFMTMLLLDVSSDLVPGIDDLLPHILDRLSWQEFFLGAGSEERFTNLLRIVRILDGLSLPCHGLRSLLQFFEHVSVVFHPSCLRS